MFKFCKKTLLILKEHKNIYFFLDYFNFIFLQKEHFFKNFISLVLVYGRVHPGPIRQKRPGSPRPKYEAHSLSPSHWGTCFSPFLQHNTEGSISVMTGYIPTLLAEYIPAQGSGRWNM